MAQPVAGVGAGTGPESADARIARVERWLDLGALALGLGLVLAAPGITAVTLRPTLLVGAGAALLATGFVRDLAWLRLAGKPAPIDPGGPREVRLCLESSLGLLAVGGGLAWRAWAPGAPVVVGVGGLVLGAALVATFSHLTRNLIVTLRADPGHRNFRFFS